MTCLKEIGGTVSVGQVTEHLIFFQDKILVRETRQRVGMTVKRAKNLMGVV